MHWWLILCVFAGPNLYGEDSGAVQVTDYTWHDATRDRDVPVRIYAPKVVGGPLPVIFFSHGLGGSREGYSYLGQYWAAHGYISVHVQHLGSDSSLLQTERPMRSMKEAMSNPDNLVNRPKDISFAIDQVTALNSVTGPWQHRFDLNHIGVSGHSFGAYTTMAIAGESFGNVSFADPRVKAVVAMSTPAPGVVSKGKASYATVHIPALHFTGTEDKIAIVGTDTVEKRRIPFDQSPGPDTYLAIFKEATHMTFSGPNHRLLGKKGPNDELVQEMVCEGSTAFWNAYLKGDASAKKWLATGGFAQAIGANGTWEMK